MHPNPAFRQEPDFLNLNLVRTRSFGTLCISADPVPMISHIPFRLNEAGTEAQLHLVRSNDIARQVRDATPAVIMVSGPDGYISPDWYDDANQVPTWNYVAVHMHGRLVPDDPGTLREHLETVSEHFETRLPKRRWTLDKMDADVLDRMMRQILPFRFNVDRVEGTWKLGQNKTAPARENAADELRNSSIGHETEALSMLMRGGAPEIDRTVQRPYID